MGQIGRLWHRMYPRFKSSKDDQGKLVLKPTSEYVELLTIFPQVNNPPQKQIVTDFQKHLEDATDFQQLW
jgi:CRISPR-associated protein Cmr6